jgi:flagellar basal body P-ring protein FlgI
MFRPHLSTPFPIPTKDLLERNAWPLQACHDRAASPGVLSMHPRLNASRWHERNSAGELPHARFLLSVCALALCGVWGCQELDFRLQSPEDERRENAKAALNGEEGHSRLVGDYVNVSGLKTVALEGIGLVSNLDGTGDDPASTPYRTAVLDDMRRRGIRDPNRVLADPSTTIVQVRAYLPPLLRKHERFDVEVRLPDGSEATSLRGGTLLECNLSEQAYVPGRGALKGHRLAVANGQILVGGDDESTTSGTLKRGVIPGGAIYVGEERNLALYLRSDYRNARMADTIARRIGERFHDYDQYGIKRPLAEAVSNSKIELIVHARYRDNYPRFLQCIRYLMLRETTTERQLRLQKLKEEVLSGPTAARASIELEAIGVDAIPILQAGLKATELEARFYAAEALAYLGQDGAAPVLREAAEQEPAFRVYALAALAALDNTAAAVELQALLNHASMETRYGAVRALSTMDPHDPAIEAEELPGGCLLRIVDSTGEPMIHLTRRKKSEIVVFGADQRFEPPMVCSAGKKFLIKAEPGRSTVTINHFIPGEETERIEVSSCVADVIRALGKLDARYPDIVQLLVEAERQHNLPGTIGIDEMPRAGRTYLRPTTGLASASAKAEGVRAHEGPAPNLFDTGDRVSNASAEQAADADSATEDPADASPVGTLVQ